MRRFDVIEFNQPTLQVLSRFGSNTTLSATVTLKRGNGVTKSASRPAQRVR